MEELEYCKELGGIEFGCRSSPYFPVHQMPRYLGEFGVEHDRFFNCRSVGTVEEVGLGYKYIYSAGELEGGWIRLGGRKAVCAEVVC
jgi:hypothetical protein